MGVVYREDCFYNAMKYCTRRAVELSQSLRQTFESVVMTELFPQSEIDISVQVLQSDGGKFFSDCSTSYIILNFFQETTVHV